jgi:lipopolysaccharide/colanic/teichoic acid biosynthesis glycosyltransferase
MKRLFDIFFSLAGLVLISPLFIVIAFFVKAGSKGPVFYLQNRVGLNAKQFKLFKFRTMYPEADKKGLLTVGGRDPRVTPTGYFLRKYKLDELPQLLNVLLGDMSLVGPRPEVEKYVALYNPEQQQVLKVRPGITDYASIAYFQENELLSKSSNPEKTYIEEVMPAKLQLNLKYINEAGLLTDVKLILKTVLRIIR